MLRPLRVRPFKAPLRDTAAPLPRRRHALLTSMLGRPTQETPPHVPRRQAALPRRPLRTDGVDARPHTPGGTSPYKRPTRVGGVVSGALALGSPATKEAAATPRPCSSTVARPYSRPPPRVVAPPQAAQVDEPQRLPTRDDGLAKTPLAPALTATRPPVRVDIAPVGPTTDAEARSELAPLQLTGHSAQTPIRRDARTKSLLRSIRRALATKRLALVTCVKLAVDRAPPTWLQRGALGRIFCARLPPKPATVTAPLLMRPRA